MAGLGYKVAELARRVLIVDVTGNIRVANLTTENSNTMMRTPVFHIA